MMERTTAFLLASIVFSPASCSRQEPASPAAAETAVRAVLDRQAAAWNAGDLDGFLSDYLPTGELRFVTGTDVVRGFEAVRERWRIDDEWWRSPISREYLAVVLDDGRVLTLYRDLADDRWYAQKD